MIIDVHAHHVPASLIRAVERHGDGLGVEVRTDSEGNRRLVFETGLEIRPFFPKIVDLDLQLEDMDANAVDVRVVSTWLDLVGYWLPIDKASRLSRLQNELMAEGVAAHSDRFLGLATVPLQDGKSAAQELVYAMETLGLRGVLIGSHVNQLNLDEPFLDPFWEAAEFLQAFVLLHPFQIFAGDRYSRYYLHNVIGNPLETTLAAACLIFGGVMARFPGLRICLSHAGGFLPFQIGRLDRAFAALPVAQERLESRPSEFLSRFYFDSILFDTQSLAFLISRVGQDRVLLGSDFPFGMGDPHFRAHLDVLEGLDSDGRGAILGGTAAQLLDVGPE